jgi:hypothetical protein
VIALEKRNLQNFFQCDVIFDTGRLRFFPHSSEFEASNHVTCLHRHFMVNNSIKKLAIGNNLNLAGFLLVCKASQHPPSISAAAISMSAAYAKSPINVERS